MSSDHRAPEFVPMRLHPRVFTALGKELVTNDVVAVMELVKNAFDAFAFKVEVSFGSATSPEPTSIQIQDDGLGMTRGVIEDAWCTVATPYRKVHPYVRRGNKVRRVAGAKGLGRLAAARLGHQLTMLTQAPGNPCWELMVDWTELASQDHIVDSTARCREFAGESPFAESGTQLRIGGLSGHWDKGRIEDLQENLARLLSPFGVDDDFHIVVSNPYASSTASPVEPLPFLNKPKYRLKGSADDVGNLTGTYEFAPISDSGTPRRTNVSSAWENIGKELPVRQLGPLPEHGAGCGPFEFEIRAWDLGQNDTEEISGRFSFQKSQIRQAIKAHKGLSVYRDGVLVLPKSDSARDWLGLDLRRVSDLGPRLSTSQLVGYVAITADRNPQLEDASNRERLLDCPEMEAFKAILKTAVKLLEAQRIRDRTPPSQDRPMADLFQQLSAAKLVKNVNELEVRGRPVAEVLLRWSATTAIRSQKRLKPFRNGSCTTAVWPP